MLKMQARMLLKLIKWHGDTRVRSVVWNWAEAVEAALLGEYTFSCWYPISYFVCFVQVCNVWL